MPSRDETKRDVQSFSQNSVSVPFDRLKEACETFSGEWEEGERPDLPSYLVKVAEDDQATLLRNLLEYEVHKRREQGESPRAEDYLKQLPEHTAVVRQVFLETSSLSLTSDRVTATHAFPRAEMPASRLGDFRLVRELGRGGMGAVFEAIHVTKGNRVALKTLPTVSPDALHRFKREFRSVAELTHPNLVGLHTLENDGGQYFITMDLISGVDFRSWVRPGRKLDESRLRSALPQLVVAVMALHAQDIIHRDLKPSNVLVTPEGRLVVLDFGLVADLAGATVSMASIAGTPHYMAPEQAAGVSVGPPADWYAIGVMLHDALVGRFPFQSNDTMQVLREKQDRDAEPFPEDHGLPPDLAELCMSLLQRDLNNRPSPLEIAGVIQGQIPDSIQRADSRDELIGRETQLAALSEANDTLERTNEPVIAFISGRSGEGKTSLAERFLASFQRGSAVVLSGRCYDRESVPFKALDTLVTALSDHLRSLPGEKAALLLPDDIAILAQLFPELGRCKAVATAPAARIEALDQQQVRARAFGALRLLLDRIAQDTPIVAFIDDLQWGDEDSARALFDVLRPPNAPPILFVGSYRSDEANDSPFLKEWRELQRVEAVTLDERLVSVGPLSLQQSTSLVVNQLGIDTESIRQRAIQFHAQTGGNPFLLTELVGCFDPESDSFHATDIHGVLDQKLANLPAEAKPLLEAVSVSGQALAPEEAMEVAGAAQSSDDTLIAMQRSRLLRVVGSKVDTYHDRIRYAILDKLATSARQKTHVRLAEVIEAHAGGLAETEIETLTTQGALPESNALARVYDLAYHWDRAANQRRALSYGLAAAAQAREQFALDVAAEQYALADRNAADAPQIVRFRIARGRGEASLLMGNYEEASLDLDRALPLAASEYDTADVIGLKGVLARKRGEIAESIAHLEDAIGRLRVRVPRTSFGVVGAITKESVVQVAHSLFPKLLHKRQCDQAEELCHSLLGQIEWSYWENNVPKLLWASLVGLNRAERVPQSPSLALQYIVHANDMSLLGWLSRAKNYYERAHELSQQRNDLWGVALATSHEAVGAFASARYTEGVTNARLGKDLFAQIGDIGEVHVAQLSLAVLLFRTGDLSSAARESENLLRSCVRHEDNFAGPCALSLLARSQLGQLPINELVSSVHVSSGNLLGQAMILMAEGQWHTFHKRTEEALSKFEQAWAVCRKNWYLNPFNSWVVSDLATALRRQAEALESEDKDSRSVRKRWQKVSRGANRLSWLLPPERPHALRELSLACAHRGRLKKALKLIRKSCQIAEQQQARYEHAQSLLVQGQLEQQLGDPAADERIRSAQAEIDQIEGEVRDAF